MIKESKVITRMDYTSGTVEKPEKCAICENDLPIGLIILRDIKTRNIICKDCVREVVKVA